MRSAGIGNIGVDLIAGLPHQTMESWEYSVRQTLATGVPHASVYMLEVDEDSRLGNELLAGGSRYHAHHAPDEDLTADMYLAACEKLERGGLHQYEISNFACSVTHGIGLRDSRHNLKYWTRQPYLGFGVDAHSMLAGGRRNWRRRESKPFASPRPIRWKGFLPRPCSCSRAMRASRSFSLRARSSMLKLRWKKSSSSACA